jgi:hypothetical protein
LEILACSTVPVSTYWSMAWFLIKEIGQFTLDTCSHLLRIKTTINMVVASVASATMHTATRCKDPRAESSAVLYYDAAKLFQTTLLT